MALRRKGGRPCINNTVKEEEFNYINLVGRLKELRDGGYFYVGERLCYDETLGKKSLWQRETKWLQRVLSEDWLDRPVEELSMEFVHFLTGHRRYLHVTWEEEGYKEGGEARLFANERQFIRDRNFFTVNGKAPCFEQVLKDCDIYAGSRELRKLPEYALRGRRESFFSVLSKHRFRQTGVARVTAEDENTTTYYWAGEFVQQVEGQGTSEYLYLVQSHWTIVQGWGQSRYPYLEEYLSPTIYMLKTKERLSEICVEGGVKIPLREMPWINRPFPTYYDLPREVEKVSRGETYMAGYSYGDLPRKLFKQLKDMGYEYRREQVWVAGEEDKERYRTLGKWEGIRAAYEEYGLIELQMEFVQPETGERMYLLVEHHNETLYMSNGQDREHDERLHTTYFREDRSIYARYDGEEGRTSGREEIILQEPVCLDMLREYELISREQEQICHLSGMPEFKDWFEMTDDIPKMEGGEEEPDEALRRQEEEKAARARRIAKSLKYQLVEKCEEEGVKIEIYANKQGTGAIYLFDNGRTYKVKYVDRYMNVNVALSVSQ